MFIKWLIDENGNKYFMDKKGHEGKIYRPKLSWFIGKHRENAPWYSNSAFLNLLVQWLITYSVVYPKIFGNNGKFKVGDKTKYNWKAKVQIWSITERKNIIETVNKICYSDKSGLEFESGNSCASYWMRKTYFWEK